MFLRIRDDQTHTAHCTLHTTHNHPDNHSGFNKSKFYNGKYTHTISRGEKDGHTDKKPEYRKFSTVRLCARLLMFYNRKIRGLFVGSPLFSPGILMRPQNKEMHQEKNQKTEKLRMAKVVFSRKRNSSDIEPWLSTQLG